MIEKIYLDEDLTRIQYEDLKDNKNKMIKSRNYCKWFILYHGKFWIRNIPIA